MELIGEGAEAKIFKINSETLLKVRVEKKYRLKIIDSKLRKSRNKKEFKVLTKLFKNKVNVPEPFELNKTFDKSQRYKNEAKSGVFPEEINFTFEFLDGVVLKEVLSEDKLFLAFDEIIKMHNFEIVHGDLTTLNMIFSDSKVFLIDFGLSSSSNNIEERAVDLNLFFSCIRNEHREFYSFKDTMIEKYINSIENGNKVIGRLKKVELRGRNK